MADEQQQCIFCHLASGQIPSKKVYEDDKVLAVLDINPGAPGHVLLITKEHVSIMPQMDDVLVAHVGQVAKQLSAAVLKTTQSEGTSLFVANGVVAGQRAPHFMLHIIPRKEGDGIALQPAEKQLDEAQQKKVWAALAPAVAKQFGMEPPEIAESESEEKPAEKEAPEKKKEEQEKPDKKEPAKKPAKLDEITEFLAGGKK